MSNRVKYVLSSDSSEEDSDFPSLSVIRPYRRKLIVLWLTFKQIRNVKVMEPRVR